MKNVLESLKESVKSGKITIREAAIKLHKAGWTSFVDVDKRNNYLNYELNKCKRLQRMPARQRELHYLQHQVER